MIKHCTNKIKKIGKKFLKKLLKHLFLFLIPLLIIIFIFCSIVDFFFFHIPKTVNAAENQELKNSVLSITDKTNISKLKLENGTKLNHFCDVNGEDLQLALKWSDLYAMVLLEDNIEMESFNLGKNHSVVKFRFNKIAKELAPKITYITGTRKITLTKKNEEKDSKEKVISEEIVYYIKNADTLYGKYNYEYEQKTTTKEDSEGIWTTTELILKDKMVTDEYKKLDCYLKKKFKLIDEKDIKNTRQQFLELSIGIYNGSENAQWLINNGLKNTDWSAIGNININPKIFEAIMNASKKYSIPPWLIMGFISRESGFNPQCLTYKDYSQGPKNPTLAQVEQGAWGLMQVMEWSRLARACGYSNPEQVLQDVNAQVDVGCYELVKTKFTLKMCNIDPTKVDWKGNGWINQTWLGCQAYNGLIYYKKNDTSRTRQYAFTKYLRIPQGPGAGTGVFDMAEKYKSLFVMNLDGSYTTKTSWPVPNYYTITSPFGIRTDPFNKRKKFHNGIDISAPNGANITSASTGIVIQASDTGNGYGNCVIVKDSEYEYLYGHMSSVSVKIGTKVTIGQELGKVGSTGRSTGNHLHFGISIGNHFDGNWIDPLSKVKPN